MQIIAESPPFDLLFTDPFMPGEMNGRPLVEVALEQQSGLMVLMASGYGEDPLMQERPLRNPLNVKSKPIRWKELAGTIRKLLDQ